MEKANMDLRVEILKSGLSYREIAEEMKISQVSLSRAMAKPLSHDMRERINIAIDELTVLKSVRIPSERRRQA